ncbi:Transcription initiation factor TFIID subunit 9B [Cichlidogyrus casuarinus]|uniref:Transcription initiation factor TFIID subunit 9B n=1 Tax=Cichlidogyrus casuarinus TaxID=1844966 RepID=A0ABD2QLR5_9PLAT
MAELKDTTSENQKDESPSSCDSLKPSTLEIVKNIFESYNLTDVTDETASRVLDTLFKHICDVFEEAKAFSIHANKKNIDANDIKLAIDCCLEDLILKPPHRKNLLNYSETVNSQPLPPIRQHLGLPVPPERYSLTASNFKLSDQPPPTAVPTQGNVLSAASIYRVSAPGSTSETVQVITPSNMNINNPIIPSPTLIRFQNPNPRLSYGSS